MQQSHPLSPNAAEPPIGFVASGSYPARAGNAVRPLIDSGPAFRRICEAVEAARHSVWLTVTFFAEDFQMPDGRGTAFDVLDRAADRGVDVRILFWRPNPESSGYGRTFAGTEADRALLAARGSRFRARWDRTHGRFCQHQKAWLIDAGHETETSFVGGINPTFRSVEPGHAGEGHRHDAYVEVTGPSATDVHHNFVQRWNQASEREARDGTWGHDGEDELSFPDRISPPRGTIEVQMQRQASPGRYAGSHPAPGGEPYDIAHGERTVLAQYVQAIDAARRTIYVENQALPVPEIAARLEDALRRGVDVVLLVPGEPEGHVRAYRRQPDKRAFFEPIEALGRHANFALAGLAGPDGRGGRSGVYVHAKLMLVDDVWATIGSCNLHANSLYGHTELNASFRDPAAVRALRRELFAEHLGRDTAELDDREAFRLFREIAQANRARMDRGSADWEGLAFRIDPAAYGV
ncbi:phosphatidylserine/phosphatidylglycerophosphate/cardiolipin synthase family protein [Paenibacillus sp. MWE-103]|uniref:Phosphatidylserine/phosphatidylglycerophosphate/ cardiolipin synthase family protein n=1 Tax=Paenibacillus artemisiicola TaxID=1172618 RepID=A0ABS3W916_9BACL|nr:phosphatidylserine/phosphatidylglycerophosphate/cardiolipin synthase family protein [Paenibacillus artemisiicola]MBO7744794.1 phosphatidylserine/phosphatidylglycerophosphate/cardiolipin synthase family protein [Paenibacillus artemisiicola]